VDALCKVLFGLVRSAEGSSDLSNRFSHSPVSRRRLFQDAILAGIGGFILGNECWAGALGFEAPKGVDLTRRWVVGSDRMTRTIVYKPGTGIFTEDIADLGTGSHLVPVGADRRAATEFSFVCNGKIFSGAGDQFELLDAEESQLNDGKALLVRLGHRVLGLEVDVFYTSPQGHPAIRKHLVLRNVGTAPLRFTHLNIESLGIALGPQSELLLNAQYGTTPREILYTGRSEDACLLLTNARSGLGVSILSEVPGYMKRTEIGGWDFDDQTRVGVMYDTDLMPFERVVAPSAEFVTAAVSLVSFRRGDGLCDPQWVLPSYSSRVLSRRGGSAVPWIYNTWEPFERGINHEIALQLIECAGSMGLDIFTIDDGWQAEYGENEVNLDSFPGGLGPIVEAVEARGMRLGLWVPLAAIGTAARDHQQHPEWACQDLEGNPKSTSTMGGQKIVMCLASDYRDAAADRIIDAVSRFHLAYVKLDLTTIFNAYGEAPGCWAKGHHHGNWAESLSLIYEGIAHITQRVYARHPEVLLDITFEVWGQKHVIDAGLLAAGDLDWLSNVDDNHPDSAGPRQARQLLYQRAASMPAESMLIGNLQANIPTIEESFATAIGSAPLLLGDLRNLSPAEVHWYGAQTRWFKAFRQKTSLGDSFFPLGSWQQTNAEQWDGFARFARRGNGLIAIFRNESNAASAIVQLPLLPEGRYRLRAVFGNRDLGTQTSADWKRGIPIPFAPEIRAEVIEVLRNA